MDMDNVLVDFESALELVPPQVLAEYEGRFDEIPGIFGMMTPIKDAVWAFHRLSTMYDTYILSTAPWENESAWVAKLRWVKMFLGVEAKKRLILTHHKNLNMGDYLVDDRTKNGAGEFTGEHIHFGQPGFENWDSVYNYLLRRHLEDQV